MKQIFTTLFGNLLFKYDKLGTEKIHISFDELRTSKFR